MEIRPLGTSGLATPPIMLGGNVFGWTADRTASFAVLDAFVDQGGTLIDTADVYSAWVPGNAGGESETIIGDWLRSSGCRDKVLIATKVGLLPGEGGAGLAPERIRAAVEASLRRLRTEVIDIYFAHMDDPATPLADTLEAFDRLVREGKVRAIGASNYSADRLAEALATSDRLGLTRFTIVEPMYNLLQREQYEGALKRLVLAEHLAAVPYYGLATGYLTGKYRSAEDLARSRRQRTIAPLMAGRGPQLLSAMDGIAAECGVSLAAIAIAWLKARPGIVAPIASATDAAQLGEIMAGARLALSEAQIALLDRAVQP
jgi:aryl-alcohol dehydrogenase-like predicted oxidoreductase